MPAKNPTMERIALSVDGGYLFAQGSVELCGTKSARARIDLDHNALAAKLKSYAEAALTLPLLRLYWHNGTFQGTRDRHLSTSPALEWHISRSDFAS